MDIQLHIAIIQLIIAYTLVGAFCVTAIATVLSLFGIVKFADKSQQKTLFSVLIVELAGGCVAFFLGFINFNPKAVQKEVQMPLIVKTEKLAAEKDMAQHKAAESEMKLAQTASHINKLSEELAQVEQKAKETETRYSRMRELHESMVNSLHASELNARLKNEFKVE